MVVDSVVQPSSFSGQDNSRYWINGEREIALEIANPSETHRIDILIEEMARINVGSEANMLAQRKGLLNGDIFLDGVNMVGFNITALEFTFAWVKSLTDFVPVFDVGSLKAPLIVESRFEIHGILSTTYLDLDGWHKGIVFINGFNIGRYFKLGPQKRLFVPQAVLKTGENIVRIFEQLEPGREIKFSVDPDLGLTKEECKECYKYDVWELIKDSHI